MVYGDSLPDSNTEDNGEVFGQNLVLVSESPHA